MALGNSVLEMKLVLPTMQANPSLESYYQIFFLFRCSFYLVSSLLYPFVKGDAASCAVGTICDLSSHSRVHFGKPSTPPFDLSTV